MSVGRNGNLLLRRGRSSAFWQYGQGRTGSSSYDHEKKKSAILAAGFCDGFITGMDFFSALRRDLVGQLADMGAILGSVCFFIVILIFLGEMIRYFKWYFPAKKEVLKGVFPVVKGSGRIGKAMFGASWYMAWCIKGRSGCEKGRFRQKLEGQSGPWEVSPFPFLCWDLSQSEYGRHLKKEYLFQRRKKHMNTGEEPGWYLRMSFRYHWRI